MQRRTVPRDLIVFRFAREGPWRYSIDEQPGSEAVLALGRAGDGIELEGTAVAIRTADGKTESLDTAIARGVLTIVTGYSYELLKNLFQMGMHNEVRTDLLFRLVRVGENPLDWDLATTDERIDLLDADGHTRASISNPRWWRIHDPDLAGELAQDLVQQAGLTAGVGIAPHPAELA